MWPWTEKPSSAFVRMCPHHSSLPQSPHLLTSLKKGFFQPWLQKLFHLPRLLSTQWGQRHLLAFPLPPELKQATFPEQCSAFSLCIVTATSPFLWLRGTPSSLAKKLWPYFSPPPSPTLKLQEIQEPVASWRLCQAHHQGTQHCQPPSRWVGGWRWRTMIPIVTKFPPEDLIQDVRVSDHKRN